MSKTKPSKEALESASDIFGDAHDNQISVVHESQLHEGIAVIHPKGFKWSDEKSSNWTQHTEGNESAMNKNEDLKYQLETLASFEQGDLDDSEFDVGYEVDGLEGFATVCSIELASRAVARIKELEQENDNLKNAFAQSIRGR